jgi:hypothetical protein
MAGRTVSVRSAAALAIVLAFAGLGVSQAAKTGEAEGENLTGRSQTVMRRGRPPTRRGRREHVAYSRRPLPLAVAR